MKTLATGAQWLFVLCLPVLLLSSSIGWAANSLWLYRYGFNKYDVSSATGLADSELEKAASGLISYFNSNEEYIRLTVVKEGQPFALFNQREVIHLRDVKGLVRLDYWVLLGTLIYALGYALVGLIRDRRRHWQRLARGTVLGSGIALACILALGLGTLLDFDQLFLQFHLFSFANEFWQLDPATDYLIRLFPQGFFYDAALLCAVATGGLAIVLGGIAGRYLLRSRRRTMPENP